MARQSKFKLADKAYNTLKEAYLNGESQGLMPLEIAKRIVENSKYRDDCQNKLNKSTSDFFRGKSLDDTDIKNGLISQVSRELQASIYKIRKKHPKIQINSNIKPRVFFYSELIDEEIEDEHRLSEPEKIPSSTGKEDEIGLEKELHEPLQNFLYYSSGYRIYSRHIPVTGNRRQQAGQNLWLFPDLVGVQDLGEYWGDSVKKCVSEGSHNRIKFWSFEVKREVNKSSIRENFLEAASNSSWANFAYLAAPEPNKDEDFERELRLLCNIHGIGFIVIDKDNFSEGYIKIPAVEKSVDWSAIDRLARFSELFKEQYVEAVRDFYLKKERGKFSRKDWDIAILDDD